MVQSAPVNTGWFVTSLFTQTLIIHVICTNKIPFIESWASWPLMLPSVRTVAAGIGLALSPMAGALGFELLPPRYRLFFGRHHAWLCVADAVDNGLVYCQVWRLTETMRSKDNITCNAAERPCLAESVGYGGFGASPCSSTGQSRHAGVV
ncbi:hypothetical protein [uncultured Desulfobulbus sp.]|uniref:hypothetical protein n=1 Tax=uncultured Desulfobulbus sp. TaxID=239745 RepID=UPI0029C8E373|nr:hypothetical protein [uncultured Desulfobulbus sp.]